MNNLLDFIKNNAGKAIGIPAVLSGLTFFGNLALALSDGVISDDEFHSLVTSASGLETLLLAVLMVILRNKNKK